MRTIRMLFILALALALAACQDQAPASTSTSAARATTAPNAPAPSAGPLEEQTPEATADSATSDSVEWAGLSIPIPPRHFGQELQMEEQTVNGAPVLDSYIIAFDRSRSAQSSELPSGFLLRIVEFPAGPEEWVRLSGGANRLSVNPATIKEAMVAGRPALVYNPSVTGTGMLQNYVVRLDDQRLLLIDTDIAYEGYETVIEGIRY